MRKLVRETHCASVFNSLSDQGGYAEGDLAKVEEILRTYMINGTTPDELLEYR